MKRQWTAILPVLFLVLIQMLIWSGPARSEQQITIVRGQDFPPYHYLDNNKREKGFLIELIQKAGNRMGLSVRFRQLPWSRCLYLVKIGQADAMMNLFKTQERKRFMVFCDTPLTHEVNRLFALPSRRFKFTGDLMALQGLKLGAVRNYSYGKAFDAVAPRLNILRLETEKALIMNLAGKRCDAIIGNEVVIKALAGQIHGAGQIKTVGPKLTHDPLYIGFSRVMGHDTLAQAFSPGPQGGKRLSGLQRNPEKLRALVHLPDHLPDLPHPPHHSSRAGPPPGTWP